MGAALLVFLYLSQTEEKTKLSNDPAITTMIISASYYAALYLGYSYEVSSVSPLNPAIAIGLITFQTFGGEFSDQHFTWIFFTFAFVGALIAVFLFEFVYKKSFEVVEEVEEEEQAEHENPLLEA